jgi:SpoVK/Ycf46/Vps4 family AAA+-type ATPase
MGPLASEFSLEGPDEESTGSVQWELPSMEFDDLWENLIYNEDVKNELISYVPALLDMSAKNAKSAILDVNRLILLYGLNYIYFAGKVKIINYILGPPGTGKTSLCKALVQRLSVRLSDRFKRSIFLEVNSHSLFSKWFSEVM